MYIHTHVYTYTTFIYTCNNVHIVYIHAHRAMYNNGVKRKHAHNTKLPSQYKTVTIYSYDMIWSL